MLLGANDVRKPDIFSKVYFTYTTTYAYLPLFIGSWNMQEHLDSILFWAGDCRFRESVGVFRLIAFLRHRCRLATFFIAPTIEIFETHLSS